MDTYLKVEFRAVSESEVANKGFHLRKHKLTFKLPLKWRPQIRSRSPIYGLLRHKQLLPEIFFSNLLILIINSFVLYMTTRRAQKISEHFEQKASYNTKLTPAKSIKTDNALNCFNFWYILAHRDDSVLSKLSC